MTNIIMLIALALIVAAIIVALVTDNSWKNVAITWSLLGTGATIFGIALTIQ